MADALERFGPGPKMPGKVILGPRAKTSGEVSREEEIKAEQDRIRAYITGVDEKMRALEARGRKLLAEGSQESPEYQKLIDQHRLLRGKQRFFESAIKEVPNREEIDFVPLISLLDKEKEDTNLSSTNLSSSEAIDKLIKEKQK